MDPALSETVLIWGDGSLGSALAVCLSQRVDCSLVGPPGSGRGRKPMELSGWLDAIVPVRRVESGDAGLSSPVSIVAVKAYDLEEVAPLVRRASPLAAVLCNGMGLERSWGDDWDERVEPCVVTAGFRLLHGSRVVSYPGDFHVAAKGRMHDLLGDSLLPSSSILAHDDMSVIRWTKWMVNSVINPLGALTGLANNMLREAGLEEVCLLMLEELSLSVPRSFRSSARCDARRMLDGLLTESGNRCSMLQDLAGAGRESPEAVVRTEIDFLTGYSASGAGPSAEHAPMCRLVSDLIRALERTAAGGPPRA